MTAGTTAGWAGATWIPDTEYSSDSDDLARDFYARSVERTAQTWYFQGMVLSLALSAAANAPLGDPAFGVFRM